MRYTRRDPTKHQRCTAAGQLARARPRVAAMRLSPWSRRRCALRRAPAAGTRRLDVVVHVRAATVSSGSVDDSGCAQRRRFLIVFTIYLHSNIAPSCGRTARISIPVVPDN